MLTILLVLLNKFINAKEIIMAMILFLGKRPVQNIWKCQVADAVGVTLGPMGRWVVYDSEFDGPKITKDGVTVADHISFRDKQTMLSHKCLKAAKKTNDTAGDGTTTATVLTRVIVREGIKAVSAGMNPVDLKRGIDSAVKLVIEELTKISKPTDEKSTRVLFQPIQILRLVKW